MCSCIQTYTSIYLLDFGMFILYPEKPVVMMCVSAGAQSPVFDLELLSFLLLTDWLGDCMMQSFFYSANINVQPPSTELFVRNFW